MRRCRARPRGVLTGPCTAACAGVGKATPPPRYDQGALIKKLETSGIGRPATFAGIIDTLLKRDYVREAASIVQASGTQAPVKLVWLREDDMRGGYYRPLFHHALAAALDAADAAAD